MLKVLLVDDEERVRRGISVSNDWDKAGIEIIGEAEDGVEALEIIEKKKPDIIITDVRMPEMDGLELTKKAIEINPEVKVIILSGYEDFNYVQTAMRHGAFDYLLKPIRIEDLTKAVDKAGKEIIKERLRKNNEEELENRLQESEPMLKERILTYFLKGRITIKEIKDKYDYLDIHISNSNFVIMVLEVEEFGENDADISEKDRQLMMFAIKNISQELVDYEFGGEVFEIFKNRAAIIINYKEDIEKAENIKKLQRLSKKINNYIKEYYNLLLTIGISAFCKEYEKISHLFEQAEDALEYKLFLGKGATIFYQDVCRKKEYDYIVYPKEKEEKLFLAIKIDDSKGVNNLLDDFFEFITKNQYSSPYNIKRACLQLVYALNRRLEEWNISFTDNKEKKETDEKQILGETSIEDLKRWFSSLLNSISDRIKNECELKNRSTIQKAVEFIHDNYTNPISLKDVADKVHLTLNYFANTFKEHTGVTVVDYITKLRIEKAANLLKETNLKISDISIKVGYSDAKYFGQVFKKNTGMTPNELRNIKKK